MKYIQIAKEKGSSNLAWETRMTKICNTTHLGQQWEEVLTRAACTVLFLQWVKLFVAKQRQAAQLSRQPWCYSAWLVSSLLCSSFPSFSEPGFPVASSHRPLRYMAPSDCLPLRAEWVHFCCILCSLPRNLKRLWDWVWGWALLQALCSGDGAQHLELNLSLGSRAACIWAAPVSEKWDSDTHFTMLWNMLCKLL